MTWDDIDAHNTGGVAEQVVAELNAGHSPTLVASIHGLTLPTVEYIMAHEEYGVSPEIMRLKFHADWIKRGKEIAKVKNLLNKIRRHIGRQARV